MHKNLLCTDKVTMALLQYMKPVCSLPAPRGTLPLCLSLWNASLNFSIIFLTHATEYCKQVPYIFVTSVNFRRVLFSSVCSSDENKTRWKFNKKKNLQTKISRSTVHVHNIHVKYVVAHVHFTYIIIICPLYIYVCTCILVQMLALLHTYWIVDWWTDVIHKSIDQYIGM